MHQNHAFTLILHDLYQQGEGKSEEWREGDINKNDIRINQAVLIIIFPYVERSLLGGVVISLLLNKEGVWSPYRFERRLQNPNQLQRNLIFISIYVNNLRSSDKLYEISQQAWENM